MQILTLELENTKSYDHALVEFTQGVNAIVGHNGAGKSTVLEAIGLAVFDTIDYRQSDFIRSGAKTAAITVTFLSSLDERPYQVVRRIGSSNQHYIFDPELDFRICDGKADVIKFLCEHLGVGRNTDLSALFRDAVGVSQGTFTAAFLETPARRKPIFDSLLQVEEYQKAYERLLDPLKLLRERKQELAVTIAGLTGRLERLPELEVAVEQRQTEITEIEELLQQVRVRLSRAKTRRVELEEVRSEVIELQSQMAQIDERLKSLDSQVEAARRALLEAQTAEMIVRNHQSGYETYVRAQVRQKELESQERERQKIEQERSAADKATALVESRLETMRETLEEVKHAEEMASSLQPAVAKQEQLEAALADARQQQTRLEDARGREQTLHVQMNRLEKRLAQLSAQRVRARELEAERSSLIDGIAELQDAIVEHTDRTAQHRVEADTIKQQTSALADIRTAVCPVCEQPLSDAQRDELIQRNEGRLAELRSGYAAAQKDLKRDKALMAERQAALQTADIAWQGLPRSEEVDKVKEELAELKEAEIEVAARVRELDQAPARIQELTDRLEALDNPRQHFAIARERADRRVQVESQLENALAEKREQKAKLAALTESLVRFADLDTNLAIVNSELEQHVSAYQSFLSNRQLAEVARDRQDEVKAIEERLHQVTADRDQLSQKLEQRRSDFDEEAFRHAVAEEQQSSEEIGSLAAQVKILEEMQANDQSAITALREQQVALNQQRNQLSDVTDQEEILETIRSLIRQAGPYITSTLIRQISDGARQIFSDIMQDYSRHLSWHEDYGVTVESDGHERQFAQLSGGEQMSAALAVRLSLLREMSDIDIAFFDEPTANLDETRRDALARQILQVKGFNQIFVISHDDTFEQATQNLIRVERVNGKSQIAYNR